MPRRTAFQPSQLHVLTMISNPARFASRYRLYREFKERMLATGATLWTCEIALGDRPFEVTSPDDPHNVQLRTEFELWHKENALNLLLARLPQDWEYCAWVDSDVHFISYPGTSQPGSMEKNWALEVIQQLQRFQVVQCWQDGFDLGPNGETIGRHESFMYRYASGLPVQATGGYGKGFGHPGYAWAFNRGVLSHLGGFLDTAILGSSDHHMCLSMVGRAEHSVPATINQAYYDEVMRWQERCTRYLTRDVGYVPGTLVHYYHGAKASRKYVERWKILSENDFVPHLDLKRDWQGLYQLTERTPKLRDDIRAYFSARNEDHVP